MRRSLCSLAHPYNSAQLGAALASGHASLLADSVRHVRSLRPCRERRFHNQVQRHRRIARLELGDSRLTRVKSISQAVLRELGALTCRAHEVAKRQLQVNERALFRGQVKKFSRRADMPPGRLEHPSLLCIHTQSPSWTA